MVAPANQRGNLLGFLAHGFAQPCSGGATDLQCRLASAWWRWEKALTGGTSASHADAEPDRASLEVLVHRYRVQSHYLVHRCWLDDPPLLNGLGRLPQMPTLLLHAGDDRVCPPQGARAIHRNLAGSQLLWVDGAGHDAAHPAMVHAMVAALNSYAVHGHFGAG